MNFSRSLWETPRGVEERLRAGGVGPVRAPRRPLALPPGKEGEDGDVRPRLGRVGLVGGEAMEGEEGRS